LKNFHVYQPYVGIRQFLAMVNFIDHGIFVQRTFTKKITFFGRAVFSSDHACFVCDVGL